MPPQAPTRRVTGKQPQPPPPRPPAKHRITGKKSLFEAPPASKASNSNIPALHMARMEAAYKMKAAGDKARKKLYTDQWAKGGPNRRLTTKSAPRAQNAAPAKEVVNKRAAAKMIDIIQSAP